MDNLAERSSALRQSVTKQWTHTTQRTRLALIFGLAAATTTLPLARFIAGYKRWLALGPGGLPYNLFGYLVNLILETLQASTDTLALDVYDAPEKHAPGWEDLTQEEKINAQKSYLEDGGVLPAREGERARARPFAIPQREKGNGEFDPKIKDAYRAAHARLGEENEDDTEWHTSVMERHGPALFLKPLKWRLHPLNAQCRGELNHIHSSDISGHAVLSFADATEVIAKAWGERHRLSGTKRIPLGYTMLYAPRSVEEVEVFIRIMRASVEFGRSAGRVVG